MAAFVPVFLVVSVEYLTTETPFSKKNILWPSITLFEHNSWLSNYNFLSVVAIGSNTQGATFWATLYVCVPGNHFVY